MAVVPSLQQAEHSNAVPLVCWHNVSYKVGRVRVSACVFISSKQVAHTSNRTLSHCSEHSLDELVDKFFSVAPDTTVLVWVSLGSEALFG